jgi:hypothetical protein
MQAKNNILVGLLFGLIVPFLALMIVYLTGFPGFRFIDFFRFTMSKNILQNLVSLCGLANLPLFYLFIRSESYESVKGVILATFILVLLVIILKFFL